MDTSHVKAYSPSAMAATSTLGQESIGRRKGFLKHNDWKVSREVICVRRIKRVTVEILRG